MIAFAPAKINIGLYVTSKRSDGFHDIETVMYPIPLYDVLEFKISNKFNIRHFGLEFNKSIEEHTCYKAWLILHQIYQVPPVEIYILKNIPSEAGLGGGSSDGTTTFKALNNLFKLNIDEIMIKRFALRIGSDCPFFIQPKAYYITGRGEKLEQIELSLSNLWITLIKPPYGMNTAKAYEQCIPKPHGKLKDKIQLPIKNWIDEIENVFQKIFFKNYPDSKRIYNKLLENNVLYASLSGTGSCFYAISIDAIDTSFVPNQWFVYQSKIP